MTPAENLLGRLDSVRQIGSDKWRASCPAHPDKHPSLDIREADDTRILLICHAGCATENVLDSIGLTFADLFPPKPMDHRYNRVSNPFPRVPREVLAMLYRDLCIVSIAAKHVLQSADELSSCSERGYGCLERAIERIAKTLELAGMCGGGLRV